TLAEDSVLVADVLANDTDPDGNSLIVAGVTQGLHGMVAINPDGTLTYTPAPNYHGCDAFTYTISDGQGGSATATVTVDVTSVPDPILFVGDSQPFTVEQGTSREVPVSIVNTDTDPRALTSLVTVDSLVNLRVYFDTGAPGQTLPRTLAPGETVQA